MNTEFKVQDNFGNIIGQENISQEQIIKLKNFLAKMM